MGKSRKKDRPNPSYNGIKREGGYMHAKKHGSTDILLKLEIEGIVDV